MSKLLRVCSSCKHYPRDEYCKECMYKFTTHDNTGLEPSEEFINKPCISESVCHEDKMKVLDKIRAEIEEDYSHTFNDGCINKNYVLSVIDKYMKEGE